MTDDVTPSVEPPVGEHGGPPEEEVATFEWWRPVALAVFVVFLGVRYGLPLLIVIFALMAMIFLHELGHYITAKRAGMKVTEFFLGFGPRLWSFRRGETEYGLKAIPAGAYVRIIGMSNLEEVDPADEARTYRQKGYAQRLSVAFAGSAMHFAIALVLWFTIVVGFGVQDVDSNRWTVGELTALDSGASPAQDAGVEVGDRIVSVDGQTFDSFDDLAVYLRARPDQQVTVVVERDGEEITLEPELASRVADGETVGYLGIGPTFDRVRMNPVSGVVDSVSKTGQTMWLSVKGLGALFSPSGISGYLDTLSGEDSSSDSSSSTSGSSSSSSSSSETRVTSIVGIGRTGTQAVEAGAVTMIGFMFLLNVFIGVFNLVPLLPFDGGHVAIATYEQLRSRGGRRYMADVSKLMPLTYAVVGVLGFLFVTSIYLDVTSPAANPFN